MGEGSTSNQNWFEWKPRKMWGIGKDAMRVDTLQSGPAVRVLGFEPVGRVVGRPLWFPTPTKDLEKRSEVVSKWQPPTLLTPAYQWKWSKSCVELNFLHHWLSEFTQATKQRTHKDWLWRGRHWVRKNNTRIAGTGVLHGMLHKGSNKLPGMNRMLKGQMDEIQY